TVVPSGDRQQPCDLSSCIVGKSRTNCPLAVSTTEMRLSFAPRRISSALFDVNPSTANDGPFSMPSHSLAHTCWPLSVFHSRTRPAPWKPPASVANHLPSAEKWAPWEDGQSPSDLSNSPRNSLTSCLRVRSYR